jgi:hypothetical protein
VLSKEGQAMPDSVTIWYTGATFQLGRGENCYAIWAVRGPRSQPVDQWPETPEGWSAAWSRFTELEAPGNIVHLRRPAAPAAGAGWVPGTGGAAGTGPVPGAGWAAGAARAGAGSAAILLAAGVALGIAGLFPTYVSGASLAQQPAELVPHVIYLAVWAASAGLILLGGTRQRAGALLGLGTSIVTFGFFFADAGTVIAGGAHLLGPGLVLGLAGWLACTAGSALAFRLPSADAPRWPRAQVSGQFATPALAALAALGAAAAFAPSWDSFTLRTSSGLTHSLTAGNSFANPGPVIAGDVAVMVALVVVVVTAALWHPIRMGAALLAGAVIPMVAQAISALVQVAEPVSSTAFGIPPAQARTLGLTISAGLTPAFWIYCAFVAALVLVGAWMLRPPSRAGLAGAGPGSIPPASSQPQDHPVQAGNAARP